MWEWFICLYWSWWWWLSYEYSNIVNHSVLNSCFLFVDSNLATDLVYSGLKLSNSFWIKKQIFSLFLTRLVDLWIFLGFLCTDFYILFCFFLIWSSTDQLISTIGIDELWIKMSQITFNWLNFNSLLIFGFNSKIVDELDFVGQSERNCMW